MYFDSNQKGHYVPVSQVNNEEDIDTIVSVVDDDAPLVGRNHAVRKVSRKKLIQILNNRFQKASKILQIQRNYC